MAITAQDVNKLRQMTGAGMMDCKKALTEANGDFEAAVDILRKKGQKVSASRSDRETSEGSIFVQTNADATEGTLIAIGCETDFVGKNEEFQTLGQDILKAAVENKPANITELKDLKLNNGRTVNDNIVDLVGKIGEKIEILAYERISGEKVEPYIHANNKLGVLVALANVGGDYEVAGKDVAMQIAAMSPVAVDKSGVDESTIQREMEIGREQARAEGKPEEMIDKIAQGKLNKFYKENTLLEQPFVKDNGMTVAKYLDSVSKGMTVSKFKRVQIG
ncbi:translation elongation factor Ts [Nafulsella turpanensis]|uniref:translation elongation factor Ts n=1 Tax=Nafulsella turpanensis TaxID=1265690 RepID=UPI000477486D|nr:translation elongation factor Ts [Nafulsella turpanensis]